MSNIIEFETKRLILRQWHVKDYSAFADMNSDFDVMEHFPSIMSTDESDEMARRIQSLISKRGWGLWATEEKDSNKFMGFVGLHEPSAKLPFSPCVEIGWRLSREFWGKGYATEAAEEVLKFAFSALKLPEVYAFTSINNARSKAVMERLHMLNIDQNFGHPALPVEHALREHILYKITLQQWLDNSL